MDSFYPEDILVGFFPLVFAVNTIPDGDPNGEIASEIEASSGKIYRSPFDRFLDAIAASLVDESDEEPVEVRRTGNRTIALFRGDDDETSDEEDILLQENCSSGRPQPRKKQGGFGFGRRSMSSDGPNGDLPTSYAKALTNGQGFFQRARIVTISTKYGFPPSKDPEGTNNLSFELHNLENRRTSDKEGSYQSLLKHYPVGGIIPSGWLDKHVHALPSAIMVVCAVSTVRKEQAEQDRLLFQTIEHLQYSLVPKRQCSILVVGLMKDDVTDEQGKEWCQAITHDLVLEDNANTPFTVTVLRASIDLQRAETDVPTSSALLRLKRTARDASLLYYLRQARRTKDKLSKLVGGKRKTGPPPLHLSPLIIRYCFKIAIFYEFQMKHEKSLRFMTEGYRSIVKYFQCLLVRPENISSNHKALNGGQKDDETIATDQVSSASVQDAGDSVEVELTSEEYHKGAVWSKPFPPPPEDILYQCLVVADWLNLKLLTAGFASHTEDGLIAASNQWRLHSRVFATARNSKNLKMDGWFEWAYICRQRIVTSQLVDRHPPTALGDVGNDFDEIILRCSPWLTYESASEAMLRLAQEIENARSTSLLSLDEQSEKNDSTRARFVGGLSTYGLRLEFVKECAINHREKALELMLRAISTFEHELVKHKRGFYAENEFSERSSSRTGARLYYVAGGILLGMHRHDEALSHLSKALRYSRGWRELELAVRRMLIECYDKHIPSPGESSESDTLVSMILDSYFNAEMSSQNLRKALDHFATISGGDTLKWYHETRNEEDTSLPFSFAVSFPGKTQATSGDVVEASVVIKSNLDYAVHVNSAALGTLAGKLPISAFDLLSAANANEGLDGGIIIQANSSIIISTKLELPRDISVIAFDESGNGGELLGVSGKGSFAKNAKPHSAGISAAGTHVRQQTRRCLLKYILI